MERGASSFTSRFAAACRRYHNNFVFTGGYAGDGDSLTDVHHYNSEKEDWDQGYTVKDAPAGYGSIFSRSLASFCYMGWSSNYKI